MSGTIVSLDPKSSSCSELTPTPIIVDPSAPLTDQPSVTPIVDPSDPISDPPSVTCIVDPSSPITDPPSVTPIVDPSPTVQPVHKTIVSSTRSDSTLDSSKITSSSATASTDSNRKSRRQLANARRKAARQKEIEANRITGEQSARQSAHLASKARQLSRKACHQFKSALTAAGEADKVAKSAKPSDFSSSRHFKQFKNQHPTRQASKELLDLATTTATKAIQLSAASKSKSSDPIIPLPSPCQGLDHIHRRLF
ncbi:uncharacterized protein LOC128392017 [Panonychus citri]|uniref:uncharacterized protein LOC128392017 n=1 Tax=Panonychus citri TaxID=50023 RepID=UPI002308135B|nr:uncharacterized protein LOC128392017 [Panonychus citri]